MSARVEVYGRQCRAVLAIAEWMVRDLGFTILAVWDTVLRIRLSEVMFLVAVAMDVRLCERRASLCPLLGHQVVLLTTPGLLWICESSPKAPGYLLAHVRQQLSRLVLQRMHEGIDGSAPHTSGLSPVLSLSLSCGERPGLCSRLFFSSGGHGIGHAAGSSVGCFLLCSLSREVAVMLVSGSISAGLCAIHMLGQ